MELTLNNLQRLICHKIQPTNQPTIVSLTDRAAEVKGDTKHKYSKLHCNQNRHYNFLSLHISDEDYELLFFSQWKKI